MRRLSAVLALLMATGIVAGCTSAAEPGQDPGSLEGRWTLTELITDAGEMAEPLADTTVSLSFEENGVMGGNGGVNSFGGTYDAQASGSIKIEVNQTTLMAGTPAADAQEQRYLELLGEAARYVVTEESLELLGKDGGVLLALDRSVQRALTGTTWYCTGYNTGTGAVTSLVLESTITAIFADDGTLSGSSGVNTYSTRYETRPMGGISISEIAVTEMAGPPELMAQEAAYLAALVKAGHYKIADDTLSIYGADKERPLIATYIAE